jgi:thymidylate synthase
MKQYLTALQHILDHGDARTDRTGTGTIGVFGMQHRYNLREGFPAMTTKKLAWKAVVSELLWFLEGSGDEGRLREILYGDREAKTDKGVYKKTIWSDNANAPYWTPNAKFPGDLGRVYGVQWRSWQTNAKQWTSSSDWEYVNVDQIKTLINGIKNDPTGRRHILSAWNPGELAEMALPPCHVLAQFYVNSKHELSCQMYQRSNDFFLGCPFNIASYALLTHMIAHVCKLRIGEFIHVNGDAHIYSNHIDQVKEQLSREPYALPFLWLNPDVENIDDFTMDDISLLDYQCHDAIKAPMAV